MSALYNTVKIRLRYPKADRPQNEMACYEDSVLIAEGLTLTQLMDFVDESEDAKAISRQYSSLFWDTEDGQLWIKANGIAKTDAPTVSGAIKGALKIHFAAEGHAGESWAKNLKPGDIVLYRNGSHYELGKVKRLAEDGNAAFVWYSDGDTASRTPFDALVPLANAYVVKETSLGGREARVFPGVSIEIDSDVRAYAFQVLSDAGIRFESRSSYSIDVNESDLEAAKKAFDGADIEYSVDDD